MKYESDCFWNIQEERNMENKLNSFESKRGNYMCFWMIVTLEDY